MTVAIGPPGMGDPSAWLAWVFLVAYWAHLRRVVQVNNERYWRHWDAE